jgi:hypothetical protein
VAFGSNITDLVDRAGMRRRPPHLEGKRVASLADEFGTFGLQQGSLDVYAVAVVA